ncbi:hydrolase [Amantichitinum ursilacus]|uniref:Isochorismatase family protein YecD n=1 Tax=Amantichitinum ursilacus TaxID=857265 RepID=A0A0N0GLL2_9NEIS|nr:hydrolase [Amantichitinum ursilacus]KPC50109.1 Isochorismatase family protein YecD [Amantichitinum ursilacus]
MNIDAKTTALVLIDLQDGILPYAGAHPASQVLDLSNQLAQRFRAAGAPVVRVRVGWSEDYAEALKQPVDSAAGGGALPANWWDVPAQLETSASDIQITKRQWGAFYGTDLELQLRRRGINTIVLAGIATNIGVESTARNAWEMGFGIVLAEDACSGPSMDMHQFAIKNIFPRISRVRSTAEILAAFA